MAPKRIMIAEDEVIFAEDLQERVQSLGYVVTANVTTAEAALQSAEQEPPDLVLMDIRLAGTMDGIEAAEVLRSKSNIPVVFVTAYADEERLKRVKLSMARLTDLPIYSLRGPAALPGIMWSDHRSFREFDMPAVLLTDTAHMRNPWYHTEQDTPDKLDYELMAKIVRGLHGIFLDRDVAK